VALSAPLLDRFRRYLVVCRHSTFEVSEAAQKAVEEDFVRLRAEDQRVTAEDLHHLLVLARLLSLSAGAKELTGEAWTRAREMERERVGRMAHLPPRRVAGVQQVNQNQQGNQNQQVNQNQQA